MPTPDKACGTPTTRFGQRRSRLFLRLVSRTNTSCPSQATGMLKAWQATRCRRHCSSLPCWNYSTVTLHHELLKCTGLLVPFRSLCQRAMTSLIVFLANATDKQITKLEGRAVLEPPEALLSISFPGASLRIARLHSINQVAPKDSRQNMNSFFAYLYPEHSNL